jgi:hypothetical protein
MAAALRPFHSDKLPTRRSRNHKLRREIRISKREIRNKKSGKREKRQSERRGLKLFPRSDFCIVSKFEFRISNLSNLAHFARDFPDQ